MQQSHHMLSSRTHGVRRKSHTRSTWKQGFIRGRGVTAQPCQDFTRLTWLVVKAQEMAGNYVWVDTCCIDKKSSSELSEAINSMYAWYERSEVCYVYLEDLTMEHCFHDEDGNVKIQSGFDLANVRWFGRGWTLQELLAPRHVTIFSKEWTKLGTRGSYASLISDATKIDDRVLVDGRTLKPAGYSVARKMSWAAG